MTKPYGNRLTLMLLIVASAVAGAIVYQHRPISAPTFQPAAAPASKVAPLNQAPSAPPVAYYQEITQRPLFIPGREPPVVETQERSPGAAPLPFVLDGIIITDQRKAVLLRKSLGNEVLVVDEGETQDGWTLEQVTPAHVLFSRGGQESKLLLKPDAMLKTSDGFYAQGLSRN